MVAGAAPATGRDGARDADELELVPWAVLAIRAVAEQEPRVTVFRQFSIWSRCSEEGGEVQRALPRRPLCTSAL